MAAQEDLRREAGAMKNEARAMWTDAAGVARSAARQQQHAAADGIGQFAGALREAARHGDSAGAAPSRLAESVADGLDRVSASIKNRDLNTLLRDVEDFARSQPLVFFGAAVLVGFAAMRFMKSSGSSADDTPSGRSMGDTMSRSSDAGVGGSMRGGDTYSGEGEPYAREGESRRTGTTTAAPSALTSPQAMERGASGGARSDTARGATAAPSGGSGTANVWPEANPQRQEPGPR